jgi:hypothetical protein
MLATDDKRVTDSKCLNLKISLQENEFYDKFCWIRDMHKMLNFKIVHAIHLKIKYHVYKI